MSAIVFAASLVIPFDTQPGARSAGDLSYISDCAGGTVKGKTLADVVTLAHGKGPMGLDGLGGGFLFGTLIVFECCFMLVKS